jgi:N-acetyl-anhydromuramyl-L-alanine amidase AmpD
MASKRQKTAPPKHTTHIVRNQSSRNGAPIQAIAVHSTESQDIPGTTRDLVAIRNWFDNPASQASSHIGVDGSGNSELWVHSDKKAWTILQLNPVTFNIEFVARAGQSKNDWEDQQYRIGAQWAAYIAIKNNIPAGRGRVANNHGFPIVSKKGVIRHKDLTDAGFGTHTDPGPNFDMEKFLRYMRYYKQHGWIL